MAKLKKPNQGWAWIPNQILQNKDMSLKAKGLWAYLNSKPDGWTFSIDRIAAETADGRDAVRSAIHELEDSGLLTRTRRSVGTGWEDEYDLRIKPQTGNSSVGNSYVGKSHVGKPDDIIKQNKVRQNKVRQNKKNNMPAPEKPAPAREIPEEAKQLAQRLHKWITKNKPDRKIQKGWEDRWATDIEKMHRLDGRGWEAIAACIDWSQRDEFWRQNILSGENLRKHYDRMSDRAKAEREQNGSQELASAIFSQDGDAAIRTAQKMGLIP